jgi:hypothetical protein
MMHGGPPKARHQGISCVFRADVPPCRFGRKFLLIEGGIQLLICEIIVGILIAVGIGASGGYCSGSILNLCHKFLNL